MTFVRLLSTVTIAALAAGTAKAQVSIPLPGNGSNQPQEQPAPPVQAPPPAAPALPQIPVGKYGRPDINPYERDIDMTVPLTFKSRNLGDLPVRLTFDDRIEVETATFLKLIGKLLNEKARGDLAAKLGSAPSFTPESLAASGVSLQYDPGSLSVVVLTIDPSQRSVQLLFAPPAEDYENITLKPAHFSGYLNVNVTDSYYWEAHDATNPTVNLNGALRFGRIVFEGDGDFGQSFGLSSASNSDYEFKRRYARLVYDEPEDYRRWLAGDLSPEIRGQQSYVQMGGIGVLRQRRRFNDFRSAVLQGNRQLVLERESTVRVIRNGVLYKELRLEPGAYDFSSLPLLTGSNDVQIEVRDSSGFVQNLNYQSYLDPIDLDPGDYEYGAYFGPTSRRFGDNPKYSGPIAFSGFYRKSFLDAPAIGVGLQASAHIQTLTGQTQFVLPGGGRLLVDGGVSNADQVGKGFSLGLGYDQLIDRGGLLDTFTLRADYLSDKFATLGNPEAINTTAWSVNGQYTHAFSLDLTLLLDGSYLHGRDKVNDTYRVGAQALYRVTPKWLVRAGVDYSHYPSSFARGGGFGFVLSLVFQPDYRRRAEARYESATDTAQLSYNQSSLNELNSFGFGGTLTREDGAVTAQGYADYSANRFDAAISHAAYGANFSSFGQLNVTTVNVGTSIAFADGVVGVGRRINDSFALLYPHENLGKRDVVVGQSLAKNDYIARSGALGAAVDNFLGSYIAQSIQYDVENPPAGYDIGPGVVRVRPSYRSGYKLKIGTDAFVSALGTLQLPNGKPVTLAGGRVTTVGETSQPVPFFTNSVGRFAIVNLMPGRRYRVEIYGNPQTFEFEVPKDSNGLVDLHNVTLGATPEGNK